MLVERSLKWRFTGKATLATELQVSRPVPVDERFLNMMLRPATLISEAAMCLAFDKSEDRYGVLTPSTAMGETLVTRLTETRQFEFV